MTLKNRLAKLEKGQAAQPLTWREFIEVDAEALKVLEETDPAFVAAWNDFVSNPTDGKRLDLMKDLAVMIEEEAAAQGLTADDDPRIAQALAMAREVRNEKP